ncbi:MAG: LLM class flavin-dependent oxidoreductase, partial [Chloroflexota bacterium]
MIGLGLGLDSRLGLPVARLGDLGVEAASQGYTSLWTNAGTDYDPLALCLAWAMRTDARTGVSVVPIVRNPPAVLALAARSVHELSGGRFTLGIGSGSLTERPVAAVREYVELVRKSAPDVPLAIGALGPRMLGLAGTHAQAAAL